MATSLVNMANVPVHLFLNPLHTLTAVLGCGTLPGGPISSRTFTATGFSLPTGMVYSESGTAADVAGMSRSADGAGAFVMRIVLKAVYDVLEQQGRAAGLPDFIIRTILNQLSVNITYTPLECERVVANPTTPVRPERMKPTCVVFGNTVTALCNANGRCMLSGGAPDMILKAIPSQYHSFSGTLSSSNIIMANWSRDMWQSVVNKEARVLASGPLGSHFYSAVATTS
ncbi:hypothetical protein KIN20_019685 [Parelaphostrongylus tenuis]|uniref:Uncharacterized protein n=1 Tax=Parelaphostrongylus tenuis TaxID=148309 RepID=A0AAD5QT53_PARTN|nr:hypothetical protein KIN20_019685 [Parelaphostrongylus tenuis]